MICTYTRKHTFYKKTHSSLQRTTEGTRPTHKRNPKGKAKKSTLEFARGTPLPGSSQISPQISIYVYICSYLDI